MMSVSSPSTASQTATAASLPGPWAPVNVLHCSPLRALGQEEAGQKSSLRERVLPWCIVALPWQRPALGGGEAAMTVSQEGAPAQKSDTPQQEDRLQLKEALQTGSSHQPISQTGTQKPRVGAWQGQVSVPAPRPQIQPWGTGLSLLEAQRSPRTSGDREHGAASLWA